MANYSISEALYALPEYHIVKRRKSLFVPIVVLLIGVALFVANSMLSGGEELDTLSSALILFGGSFVGVGVVLLFVRFSDSGLDPYHNIDGCFLKREELKFQKEQRSVVHVMVMSCVPVDQSFLCGSIRSEMDSLSPSQIRP